MLRFVFLLLILPLAMFPQSWNLTALYGDFDSATSFSSYEGGFYVADKGNNTIVKIDSVGNIKKIIGGYGWDESSFDDPSDIFSTTLKVLVADKNNNRVQVFDRYLNFLFSIKFRDVFYPTGCAISPQGDFFILDSDNLSILKYDMTGNFVDNIGEISSGDFTLQKPTAIAVSKENNLYVADSNRILIFDLFGSGKSIIKLPFTPRNMSVNGDLITFTTSHKVFLLDLKRTKISKFDFYKKLGDQKIIDAFFRQDKCFVLTENKIAVFSFTK